MRGSLFRECTHTPEKDASKAEVLQQDYSWGWHQGAFLTRRSSRYFLYLQRIWILRTAKAFSVIPVSFSMHPLGQGSHQWNRAAIHVRRSTRALLDNHDVTVSPLYLCQEYNWGIDAWDRILPTQRTPEEPSNENVWISYKNQPRFTNCFEKIRTYHVL